MIKKRRLGRTGLEVSELVFGGGWVGGLLIDADDETRRLALDRAFTAGVNWIDTAPSYGDGKSERVLGRLLGEFPQRPNISSKVRIDPTDRADLRSQIERSLDESCKRLDLTHVELFQLHNQITENKSKTTLGVDDVIGKNGVADVFDNLRAAGRFDHIGFTALGDTASIGRVVDSGRFDTAQVYYNMLNPSAANANGGINDVQDFEGMMHKMRAHDMGILAIRVFAAGVLATRKRNGREVMVAAKTHVGDEERRAEKLFSVLGERYGTRAQTALRFVLANQSVAGAIFGLATLDHLDQIIACADLGPMDEAGIAIVEAAVTKNFA